MGVQKKVESTVIGLKYPTGRDNFIKTGSTWLNGKREDDGAEGLWRVGEKIYDLNEWARNHPGGEEWITLTKGTDITEAFEAHHVNLTAERLLPKFYVRDAVGPRSCPFTFKDDGFYRRFKARAREALKDVDFHSPSLTSKLIADFLCVTSLVLCLVAAATQSWIAVLSSAIFLSWTSITAHNFFHQRDTFRMYYFDLLIVSSKEWRVTHALSHHLYTNTMLDIEVSIFEPFMFWLPNADKPTIQRSLSRIYSPVLYLFILFVQGLQRIYSVFFEWKRLEFRDVIPLLIPASMCLVATPFVAVLTWIAIIIVASFYFVIVGVNAAHHHPDIFHDGDVHRDDYDWGLAQLDAVRDRAEIETSIFLVLVNFGTHALHHLLPTVDHAYLKLCTPALLETCKEFDVDVDVWSQWELFKGQYAQLGNNQPKTTPNKRGKYVAS